MLKVVFKLKGKDTRQQQEVYASVKLTDKGKYTEKQRMF